MCTPETLNKHPNTTTDWSLNRRQFIATGAAGALVACAPASLGDGAPDGASLTESAVSFATEDGTMDAVFIHPASGAHPAILMWPDIAGIREANRVMARRLAAQGYAVLLANPYYRDAPAPQFEDMPDFRGNGGFAMVRPWRERLSSDAVMRDARAAIGWLDMQDAVDTARGVGSNGYCMGGPFTVYTAYAVPDRVRAAASLHGGGLVREDAHSPHRLLAETQASYLFAIAQDDDAEEPDAKTALAEAAEAAGRPAEVDVYTGNHGWTVIDNPSYAEAEAERAWAAMSALFETL